VDLPFVALNQVSEERCRRCWCPACSGQGAGADQNPAPAPAFALVPLPDTATRMAEQLNAPELFGSGPLTDAVLKWVRDATSLDIKRGRLGHADAAPVHEPRCSDEADGQRHRNLSALRGRLGSARGELFRP
jgi:ATP-dependent helicase HrpA